MNSELEHLREVKEAAVEVVMCHDRWESFVRGEIDETEVEGVGKEYAEAVRDLRETIGSTYVAP